MPCRQPYFWVAIAAAAMAVHAGAAESPDRERELVAGPVESHSFSTLFDAARQMKGGDLTDERGLRRYVEHVGVRIARAARDPSDYEFAIVDSSEPVASALPGGRILLSRGMLTQLRCESQLAELLAREMVLAPQRIDPLAAESLTSAARQDLESAAKEDEYVSLVVGEAAQAANLLARKHNPEAIRVAQGAIRIYLERAGYGAEAVTQRCAEYERATRQLREFSPAYAEYDQGVSALRSGDLAAAEQLAQRALEIAPKQGKFHELLGDIALAKKAHSHALRHYARAMELEPNFFRPYLSAGIAALESGDAIAATRFFEDSMALLPTAAAAYRLGMLAQEAGDLEQAIRYFQLAAASDSDTGRDAARQLIQLDLTRHPERYVHVEPEVDAAGQVWMVIRNRAPFPIEDVVVAAEGAESRVEVSTGGAELPPGSTTRVITSLPRSASIRLARVAVAKPAK